MKIMEIADSLWLTDNIYVKKNMFDVYQKYIRFFCAQNLTEKGYCITTIWLEPLLACLDHENDDFKIGSTKIFSQIWLDNYQLEHIQNWVKDNLIGHVQKLTKNLQDFQNKALVDETVKAMNTMMKPNEDIMNQILCNHELIYSIVNLILSKDTNVIF